MSTRGQLNRARRRAKNEEEAVDLFIRDTMATANGRQFMWWILTITNYGGSPFAANPYSTAFNCWIENVGKMFLARVLTVAPQSYITLLQERKDEYERQAGDDVGGYDFADPRDREAGDDEPGV